MSFIRMFLEHRSEKLVRDRINDERLVRKVHCEEKYYGNRSKREPGLFGMWCYKEIGKDRAECADKVAENLEKCSNYETEDFDNYTQKVANKISSSR